MVNNAAKDRTWKFNSNFFIGRSHGRLNDTASFSLNLEPIPFYSY